MMSNKNAIILCSGGLDSVVTAFYVKKKLGYGKLIFLFFDYGQRARKQEEHFARENAKRLDAKFEKIKLNFLSKISTSLINKEGKLREIKRRELKNTKKEMLNWYVPCRNTIFMIHALALSESLLISEKRRYDIFLGFKNEGKEHYPDTTKEFLNEMNRLQSIAVSSGKFKFMAPLIDKDKDEIILIGKELGVDFKDTYSCYVGIERKKKNGKNKIMHCGYCLNCRLRQEGFYWANIRDETEYEKRMKDFRLAG